MLVIDLNSPAPLRRVAELCFEDQALDVRWPVEVDTSEDVEAALRGLESFTPAELDLIAVGGEEDVESILTYLTYDREAALALVTDIFITIGL